MSEILKYTSVLVAALVIFTGLILAGCSTGGTASTTQDTTSFPTQTTATPGQTGTTSDSSQAGANFAGQQGTAPQGNAQAGRQGGPDMSKMFSRAAQIQGVTEDQLTIAYQQAQVSVFGKAPTGAPPSGTADQPPVPPTGTSGQQPPQPPSGGSGRQPPSLGQEPDQENMQKVYSKMSEILNISADKISSAMDQARQELQTGSGK